MILFYFYDVIFGARLRALRVNAGRAPPAPPRTTGGQSAVAFDVKKDPAQALGACKPGPSRGAA